MTREEIITYVCNGLNRINEAKVTDINRKVIKLEKERNELQKLTRRTKKYMKTYGV